MAAHLLVACRVGTATHATGDGVSEWCSCKHERCRVIRPLHGYDSGIDRRSTRTCLILNGRLPGIPIRRGWWEASLGGHARRETRSRGAHMPFVSLLDTSDTLTTPARPRKQNSSIRHLGPDPTSSDRVQVGRQGFVERSCRSDSPMGIWLEAHNREARSIGQTEINV